MWSRVLRVAMLTALWGLGDLQVTTTVKPGRGKGSNWWGIAKTGEPNNLIPFSPGAVSTDSSSLPNLRKKQKRLIRENPGVFTAISKGANMAIQECQHQFKNRRWNCSTRNFLRGKNLFGKIVDKGCRETAFIYAITSAAVTHAVARACSEGLIDSCTCGFSHQSRGGQPNEISGTGTGIREWEWGGCSDNIDFGYKFSREFVDAGEKGRNAREKMNLHNNEAGRAHVRLQMRQECKCHGMSGSCTTRTCWMRLPNFRIIGDNLKEKFEGASRILITNAESESSHGLSRRKRNRYKSHLLPHNPDHKPPGSMDLVYTEPSPQFCDKNSKLGILGTTGRVCNETSVGVDGCDLMCCGRGYKTQEMTVVERCGCTFQWCCEVKCNVCRIKKNVHTCL